MWKKLVGFLFNRKGDEFAETAIAMPVIVLVSIALMNLTMAGFASVNANNAANYAARVGSVTQQGAGGAAYGQDRRRLRGALPARRRPPPRGEARPRQRLPGRRFAAALASGAAIVVEMDADHSHNPKYLAPLVRALHEGADVAIGSRYVHGVRVENWPFRRLLLSRFANVYVNLATGLPAAVASDATSGYRGYRREVLEAIGLDRVPSNGYSFQVEMAYRAWRLGFRVGEEPITFEEHYLSASKIGSTGATRPRSAASRGTARA